MKLLLLCLVLIGLTGCRTPYHEATRAKMRSVLGSTFAAKEAKVQLDELQLRHAQGLITAEEYEQKKAEILHSVNQSSPTWTERPRKRPNPPVDDLRHP